MGFLVVAAGLVTTGANAGAAPPTTATIVDPGTNLASNSGDANTTWTIVLPPQASCSGDTANMGYHVDSYIVLDSAINSDPSTLTFNASSGPNTGLPLFDSTGGSYVSKNTAPVTGQVIQIPSFNFAAFAGSDLPSGLYDVGIACSKPTTGSGPLALDKFWNVQENVVSSPSAASITSWAVVGSTVATTTSSSVPGSTTTSSSVPGSTTTSSSVPGSTTTSSSVADSTTSSSVGGSGSSGSLPLTGGSPNSLIDWAVILLSLGIWVLWLSWRRRRETRSRV